MNGDDGRAPAASGPGTGEAAARPPGRARRPRSLAGALVAVLAALSWVLVAPAERADAAEKPTVKLSETEAGTGGSITVTGEGWRPDTLLMILVCGQNMIGGTNACANAEGRAVTTGEDGAFSRKLPVAEPPKACPCVVHVATVTGDPAAADAKFVVAGHPVKPLPKAAGTGKLSVLNDTRLAGSSGVLTWFGAPAGRDLVLTVGNLGSVPVKDPVFEVGLSHGVFAPQWEEQQWRGTIQPGKKAKVTLPVQLSAGAHGNYLVSLRYGEKLLAEQPWGVGRPWGVTLFWVLLCVVVPAAVFRIGMAVVDRVRPGTRTPGRSSAHRGSGSSRRRAGPLAARTERTVRISRLRPSKASRGGEGQAPDTAAPTAAEGTATLPWFTPDTTPGAQPAGQLSAPSENRPTTKGSTWIRNGE